MYYGEKGGLYIVIGELFSQVFVLTILSFLIWPADDKVQTHILSEHLMGVGSCAFS